MTTLPTMRKLMFGEVSAIRVVAVVAVHGVVSVVGVVCVVGVGKVVMECPYIRDGYHEPIT